MRTPPKLWVFAIAVVLCGLATTQASSRNADKPFSPRAPDTLLGMENKLLLLMNAEILYDNGVWLLRQEQKKAAKEKFLSAVEFLKEALEEDDMPFPRAHLTLGMVFRELGNRERATEEFEKAIKEDPGLVRAYIYLSELRFYVGDFEGACDTLKPLFEFDSNNFEGLMLLAHIQRAQGKMEEAAATLERITMSDPEALAAHLQLAKLYENQGVLNKAANQYMRVIELDPERLNAYYSLGQIHIESANYDAAIGILQMALEVEPESTKTLTYLGSAYHGLANSFEAKELRIERDEAVQTAYEILMKASDIVPNDPLVNFHLGRNLLKQGKEKDAEQRFLYVIDLEPRYQSAYLQMGELHLNKNDYRRAKVYFKKAAALGPETAVGQAALSYLVGIELGR